MMQAHHAVAEDVVLWVESARFKVQQQIKLDEGVVVQEGQKIKATLGNLAS